MTDYTIAELLLFQLFLIFLNAIFACAEIAVISINDNKLKRMADSGDKRASRLISLTAQPAKFLATIQIGITLAGFLGSAFAADNFSDRIVYWLISLGVTLSPKTLDVLSVIGITLILSYVTLILGELVPKRIAMNYAEKIGLAMSGLIYLIAKIFSPLVWFLTASTNAVLHLLHINPEEKNDEVTEEEIRIMVEAGSQNGTIDDIEKSIIHNVFEFDDITAEEVMTHRTDVTFLDIDDSPEVIFAIPLDITHASHNYLSSKALPQSGLEAYGCTGSAQNGSCAVPQFIDTYDPEDKRLTDTWTGGIQYKAVENSDGTVTPQAGDPIPFTADDWSGTGYLNYNQNVHSIDNPGAYQQEGYRFVKSEICPGTDGTYGNDVAFYRLADAMFIKAECLLRLGGYNGESEQVAADLITEVRQRSFDSVAKATRTVAQLKGGSVYDYGHREYTGEGYANWDRSTYVYTEEGGDDIILGGLLDDLAWEFVGEHHRRQDLIRFKMQDGRNVFNGKSWFCKDATTETHWDYFPIPKTALDANLNLKQNEGYQD